MPTPSLLVKEVVSRRSAVVLLTNGINIPDLDVAAAPIRRAVNDAVQRAIRDAPLIDWEAGYLQD